MGTLDLLIPVGIALGAFAFAQVSPMLAIAALAVVVVWANPLFSVIGYRLTERALEVTVLGVFCMRRVPYGEIVTVRRVGWSELFTREARWAESLGSNIFRPLVLIRRLGRRPAIITPGHTDAFVAALTGKFQASGNRPSAAAAGGAG
jgi:hypothetical protein